MIKEIAFNGYPCANVKSTREWYQSMLGVHFGAPYEQDGAELSSEANVGNGYFSLVSHEWIGRPPGSASGVAFEVDHIEEMASQLRVKGVAVEGIYETPVCKMTSLEDPEGNKVTLHQITAPH